MGGVLILPGLLTLIIGLQLLFTTRPDMISTIYLENVLSVITFTVVGLVYARFFAKLLQVPSHYLLPTILIFCIIGAYAAYYTVFEI